MKNIFVVLFSLLALVCRGQSGKLFTADKELSSTLINKIYQDRNGMIWIATENGLNRYDGCKFTVYKHDPKDPHSLCNNFVWTLCEDRRGHLIVGTYGGIQVYDPATDKFSMQATWEDGRVFFSNVGNIVERKNGEIWISGNDLCTLHIEEDRLTVKKVEFPIDLPVNITDCLLEDRKQNMWVCKRDEVYCLRSDGQLKSYLKGEIFLNDICEDTHGNIYLGTVGKGLLRYDADSDRFLPILYKGGQNLPIRTLYPAGMGEIYIGTDGKGVKRYNIQTQQLTDYWVDNGYFKPGTSKVHSILKDDVGNYWIAIYQKGVMVIPAVPNNFKYMGSKSVNRNMVGSNCITSFCRDNEGTLWIGTDNDGIYGVGKNMTGKVHFRPTDDPRSVPPIVLKLYEDSERNLWAGSFTKGMGRIDRQTGKCTYLEDLTDRNETPVQRVYDFVEDKDKRLWIATMGAGLFYYDLKTHRLHNRWEREGEYINNWITCLLYSTDNKIYAGTYDGVFCIDLSEETMPSTIITEREHIIFALCEDRQGTVWMGSTKGLIGWNPHTGKLDTYTLDEDTYNAVYALQVDERNNLWISTNNGLIQFNLDNRQFVHFYVEDGLQGNEFSKNASFRDADGTLWFGGMNGVTYFKPQEIINPARKWDIRITDFYLYDRPVRKGMFSGGHEIIQEPVFEAGNFRLGHNDNAFTIEFSTVGYSNSDYITYHYSLDDNPWITLPAGSNRVSFSELASGTHRFRVKATDHTLPSNIREITIRIAPAWWETWWAHLLGFLLVVGVVVVVLLNIRHRYRTRQKMLEHIHAKQIDEAKLQFFINISHEIRTPMSLIISPLIRLMESDKDAGRQRVYSTIYRNADRILHLINQLMDIRKIEKGQMVLRFREVDIIGFINDVCQTFSSKALEKNIACAFRHEDDEELKLWISPTALDKIFMNVLSNAFKFTPEGGKIDITLHRSENPTAEAPLHRYAEIVVADTGIGIPDEEKERIFHRFYQGINNSSGNGTGIGLHLTRSLVEMHHGTIHAENNPDGLPGCRFIIRLPLGNEHLRPDEMETEAGEMPFVQPVSSPSLPVALAADKEVGKIRAKTRFRILVVEDDTEIRDYLRQELEAEYHITESCNGKEALENIFRLLPDLVISDIMMPEMDGLELCRRIKQNIRLNHIPVILLTAKVREADNLEGLETGADAYITKPFNIDILRQTARNLINGRERLRNTFGEKQLQEDKLKKLDAPSPDEQLMERVMRVINDNLSNPSLSVEMIAETVGISRVHLHRKLKALTNQTTRDFIRNVRLKQAATLLKEKRCNIGEVARLTGFTDPNNFSTAFKNLYGISPTAYMNSEATIMEER